MCFGDTPEERRALNFWLSETGPTLGNYGPDYGFWCSLIPMWAWQAPTIRHLLVATTLIDEDLGFYRRAKLSRVSPLTIWHYNLAIKSMASTRQPHEYCLTLASLIAWVFETMLRDFASAQIHLVAARSLFTELETSLTGLNQSTLEMMAQTKPMLLLGESYAKVVCGDDCDFQTTLTDGAVAAQDKLHDVSAFQSLKDARDSLLKSMKQYQSTEQTEHDARVQRLYVRDWHNAGRRLCSLRTEESQLYKKTVQILFNLGMAFLPESEVGAYSYQSNPNAVEHLLKAIERIATEMWNRPGQDQGDIEQTLVMSLDLMIPHIRHDNLCARAALLLQRLRKVAA